MNGNREILGIETKLSEVTINNPYTRFIANFQPTNTELTITSDENRLWFNNKLFVFPQNKIAFCVMEKNSCTMFKQIFKRMMGKKDWLSRDYTKIHYLPYRGLEKQSFRDVSKTISIMNDNSYNFAAFIRDPLERLVSGYTDKCIKKRGVNLCEYAKWGNQFTAKYGKWNKQHRTFTPEFEMWADGLIQCPCWPEVDKHFAQQNLFCNLYQYSDRFELYRFENKTHRKIWMQRNNLWNDYGSFGWSNGNKNDKTTIVDMEAQSHQSTNKNRKDINKYVKHYSQNSTVTSLLLDAYRNDYIIFGLQLPKWICDPKIKKTKRLIASIRNLPRTSYPPCPELEWLLKTP